MAFCTEKIGRRENSVSISKERRVLEWATVGGRVPSILPDSICFFEVEIHLPRSVPWFVCQGHDTGIHH